MKKLLMGLLVLGSFSAFAADFTLSSREYKENNNGEIIQVDATFINNTTKEQVLLSETVLNTSNTYTCTQVTMVPATKEVRDALKSASGQITIEGTVLNSKTTERGNTTFVEEKIFVREVN